MKNKLKPKWVNRERAQPFEKYILKNYKVYTY